MAPELRFLAGNLWEVGDMSLTNGFDIYAALSSVAMNKMINSVAASRPKYFNYSSSLASHDPDVVTLVSPILVPGTNQTIDYTIALATPAMLLYPDQFNPAPPVAMPIAADQFGLALHGDTCIVAGSLPNPLSICARIAIWAVGHTEVQQIGSGHHISLTLDRVQIDGAGGFSPLLQYILLMMLNGVLSRTRFPVSSVAQDALPFRLADGPEINGQPANTPPGQLKVWGALL
ncbi:MAG: hypothetical protein EOS23_23935 [Mesorhizobium sp.]|nr:MAG: hypothetical protein EOS23_23935 [Mesorhizobium sp.]